MAPLPNPNENLTKTPPPSPESPAQGQGRSSLARRLGLGVGLFLLLAAGGGAMWTWLFVRDQLVPLVQTSLGNILNRPVAVGELEQFGLTGVRFGPSAIPPTATDPDQMTIQAIAVGFNPLQAILTRTVTFDITIIQPSATVVQSESGEWLETELTLGPPGFLTFEVGQVRLQDGTLTLVPQPASPQLSPTPVVLSHLQAEAALRKLAAFPDQADEGNVPQHLRFQAQGRTASDGLLQATGEVTLPGPDVTPAYTVTAAVRSLTVTDVSPLVTMPLQLQHGQVEGQVTIASQPDSRLPHLEGSVRLQDVVGTIAPVPQPVSITSGQIRVKGSQLSFHKLDGKYGAVPVQVNGKLDLHGDYDLRAEIPAIAIATALKTAQVAPLPVGIEGTAQATVTITGPLLQPVIAGAIATTQPTRVDRVVFEQISGSFKLNGPNLLLSDLKAKPLVGGTIAGQGQVKLTDPQGMVLDLTAQDIPADTFARLYGSPALPFNLGPMMAQIQVFGPLAQVQTVVNWQAPQATYPAQGALTIAGGVIRLQKALAQIDGGQLAVQAEIANGRWQAIVDGQQLPLARLQPTNGDLALQGVLEGQIQLAGSLEAAGLATTQATAQLQLPQGVTIQRPQGATQVSQPITAQLAWDGEQVLVQTVNAGQIQANGTLQVDTRSAATPSIQNLTLNLAVDRYDLQTLQAWLPATLPVPVETTGWASFSGQLRGTPSQLALVGDLQLEQLVVNQWTFAPRLAGPIHFAPDQGLELALRGDQDQIQLTLTPDYRPSTFLIQRQDTHLAGTPLGDDTLRVTLANLPLGIFNFTPAAAIGLGAMTGSASGEAILNLHQWETTGTIAIADPALGYLQADAFRGEFRYGNGVASLQNGVLTEGQTQVQVTAHFNPAEPAPFQANIHVPDARTQDLLRMLQWFELSDIGRGFRPPDYVSAATVRPVPIEASQMSILAQMQRLAELQVLQEQQAAALAAQPLPPLIELNGHFRGDIHLAGSLATGPTIDFQFQGADWQWGNYTADEVLVQGKFADGVVSFLPIRLTADEALLTFTGQLGITGQSGQFRAENIPIDLVRAAIALPFDMTGQLNAQAAIAGTLANPQARGEMTLVNGTLNQAPIEQALGSFSYADARLDFGATMAMTGPDPIQVIGSIPYQLPFASTAPNSDEIKLDVDVQDSGLALLNVLSRSQLNLVAGQGNLNLQVRGTLADPIATGSATLEAVTLTSAALPEPITDVHGTATFDRDRIRVETLKGRFGGGQILAQGVIPIAHPLPETDPDWENPVTIDLQRLRLKLQPYEGDLTGQVQVTGSAFTPALEGELTLADGQIRLVAPTESPLSTSVAATPAVATTRLGQPPPQSPIALNNLQISLGRNIQIVRQPLLNFVATGDLTINGNLTDIEPSGTIRLRSGQVNLFTTEFVLARSRDNTATFSPDQGLDPYLDIQLTTIVPEVTRTPIPTSTVPEVNDAPATNLGALRTIRVQAQVMGLASELADTSGDSEILTLTSTPLRNEAEIVALLGGSFINSIAQGESSLVLANLAGSALLTNIQSQIGNALGLTDFRLFPVLTPNRESRSSTLGLGAEIGIELPGNLSISALRVLTDDQIGQFSLRYRINDEMLFRGSTDLSGNSQALLEYESRF
ncbi:translocation/assembly module TamB domain-containing protein [Trichothermofontia sp.]